MRKLMDSLDMTGNEIINVSMQKITSFPTDNLFTGRLIYLESDSEETPSGYYYYNGEEWVSIGGEGSGSNNIIDHTKINVIENEFEVNKFDTISDARTYIKSKEGDNGDLYGTGFIIIIGDDTGLTGIGYNAFNNCHSIKSVYIPNGVTSIGSGAFSACISLTSITIPNTVTSIGSNAFTGCKSLKSISIPNTVTSIDSGAFADCTSLTSITIPSGSLKSSAFSGCTGLISVSIDGNVIVTSNDYYIFAGCTSLQNVYLKSGYTYIGNSMFNSCTSLQNIDIPNSVKTIDTYAFAGCKSLTSINIPEGVTTFGNQILIGCSSLRKVTIPSTVTTIPDNPFLNCTNIEILEWKTTKIPDYTGMFSGCTKLRYVEISASKINANMFKDCTSLTTVKINNDVKTIGNSAFTGCTSLTSITIPSGVTSIGNGAFTGCTSLTSITIPSGIANIYESTFNNCTSLKSINIPNGVYSISDYAFASCTSLTSITIPSSVTSIGRYAFTGCTSLTSITIPSGVTSIGVGAFRSCTSLTDVSIPGRFINTNLFNIIPGTIEYLTVTSGSISGNTSFPAIFKNSPYIKNIVINSGSGILDIAALAFSGCTSLTGVTMTSVTSIGSTAFGSCTSLTNITIPVNVTSIGEGVFMNCTSLKSVTINANTTNIKSGTFDNCTGLESVSIGSYITTIEQQAFSKCTSLTSITIPSNVTTIGSNAFYNCISLTSITINNTSNINIAGTAFAGLNSLNSVTIKGNATLGSFVFAGCSNLKNIYIDEVTEIGNGMFSGCNNLSYISMKKATTIYDGAFSGCASLKSITIPNTVTSIGSTAFTGCDIMALEPYKTRTGYPWGAANIYIQNEDVTTTIDQNSTDRQVPTAKAIYNFIRPILRYGFRINKNNSDPDTRVEYLYDAVGMTPAKMTYDETTHKGTFDYGSWGNVWFIKNNRPVKLNFNGTVEAELNPNNYWETVDGQDSELETSTNCNFMSEIPIVYVKRWEDENYNYVVVCDKQYDEDYLAYANTDKDGNLKPLYAPMFKGYKDSNNILRSIAGVDPMNNTTTSNEVMYSNNINTSGSVTGWQIEDVAKHELISDLLTLISKNTDSQTVFGNGVCQTSTRVFTGYNEIVTDTKAVKSDCGQFCGYNDNVHHVNIFHIQDFWGNRWDRCLGLITSGGKYYYKMTLENGGYVYSETITDYTNNGYTIAQDYSSNDITPPASGYIKNQSTGIFGNLPINTTGASDSTYYCDNYWYNSSGVRLLLLGGSYGHGRDCGSRFFNVNNAPSSAYVYIGASPFYV